MRCSTIIVRVDEIDPLPRGSVSGDGSSPRAFSGWLALLAALQAELRVDEREQR
jgi:hypothetical protein